MGYGGETTCLEIHGPEDGVIVVDAGTGILRLGRKLNENPPVKGAMLFTHAHWDHISGFPFFDPLHQDTTELQIICCAFRTDFVTKMLEHTMEPPHFPLPLSRVEARLEFPSYCAEEFDLYGLKITTIPLSHPNGGVGYKFTEGDRSFVFLTDNELGYNHPNGVSQEEYREFCRDAELLIHDAEYTPEEYGDLRRYGHSTYTDALDLALSAEVKRFALFHHNRDRTDDQIDNLVAECRRIAVESGSQLEVLAMSVGLTLNV